MLAKKFRISSHGFTLVIAAYYTFIINAPLIVRAYFFIHEQETLWTTLALLIPFILFLFSVAWCLVTLLSIRGIEKIVFIILTNISAILVYFYVCYGTVFYDNSPIVGAIMQTNFTEAKELLKPSLLISVLLFGLLPSYVIYQTDIIRDRRATVWIGKVMGIAFFPVFFICTLLPTRPAYQPMLVLSGLVARPPFQIIPTNFFENLTKHFIVLSHIQIPHQVIGKDAIRTTAAPGAKPDLLVLVIGETARSQNFSLNGYPRATNPYTAKQAVISFKEVSACSTLTWVSVPCLFSNQSRRTFNPVMAEYRDNLLDVLKRTGLSLFWIDNNGAGNCQGVCHTVQHKILDDLDGAVVDAFKQQTKQLAHQDTVMVLHIHGSHGPDYFEKYPVEFAVFKPDCREQAFRLCSQQTLLNAYDNSILYSDFVLNEVIELLQQLNVDWNTALIYTSDHGESIGENKLYGHGMPYFIAPKVQTQVPFLVWMSDAFRNDRALSTACLEQKADHDSISHDYFFHSVLGLLNIKTAIYQPKLDIFQSCQNRLEPYHDAKKA